MKRFLCLALAVCALFSLGCSAARTGVRARPKYDSYKQISGITQEEIAAIEELLLKRPSLVYGFCISTEAFVRDDGSVGGFAALFTERMSELFGFSFSYEVCSWEEMNEKIVSGEIDLVGDFTPTPERLHKFIMTDAIIQRTVKVFTDAYDKELSIIAGMRPLKCAFMEGSNTYSLVKDTWDLPFAPVFIEDQAQIPDLFLRGEIDAFIEEGMLEAAFAAYDYIQSEDYYPLTYSPISLTTGNPEIAPVVSVMQKYIQDGGNYELVELYNKGYQEYLKHELFLHLTEEEKAYIRRHNTPEAAILVGCEADNYPTCFYNDKEEEFQGVAIDVMDRIADLTGLAYRVGNGPKLTWPELLSGLEEGQYSMITELIQTPQRRQRFLWAGEAYHTDYYAMLSRADYPDVDINQILFTKVGLLQETAYTEAFLEWFPDSVNATMYMSNAAAFDALEKGDIDLLMSTQNSLLYITNYLEKPSFKANVVFPHASDSFFGFYKEEDVLRSIVDKAQHYVDTEEISERWKRRVFDYEGKLLRDIFPYLILFVALLAGGLFAVVSLLIKNRRIGKNLERLVEERTQALALQTSTLTTVFSSIPDIIFCKDTNLNFTNCNRSFEKHFGKSQEDIMGKDDTNGLGIPFEAAERFREADRQVMRERRTMVLEEIIPAADGSTPLFETVKIPLIQEDAVIGIMGISRDITLRKAAEETLKLTLDNLDTCIYISEIGTGEILFINDRMAKEFGGGEFYGQICWKVLQDGFTEQCEFCPVPKLLASGDEYYIWEEHNTVTGRYYKNTDSLIKWHDGRLVHMQHSVDITDSVKLQRELEHASKAKSDFLSRMSHEIRTPLNAIIGMNNIAGSTVDLEKIRHCQERIDNASKHLLGLINDILDMSKIEADKFELSYSEFDFEKMLMNITNVVNFRADEKRQNLVVNLNKDVPNFLIGDELRLSQVITNLLTNAVKFTPEKGTVILNVEKVEEFDGEVTLRAEVVDNGIGISEEQKSRLFTSFEQADGGISRKFGGTGLGLAISKRIVELMNGRIWIESELGKGSKFIFVIKAKRGREKTRARISEKLCKDNIRILAVDDCVETREYFLHIMGAHGLPCDVAADGEEALAKIQNCGEKAYTIFFVDWLMPGMDGIALTKRIREITGDNAVVIMISVADWSNIEAEALEAGVKQFIPKPLFPSVLIDTINECFGVETSAERTSTQTAGARRVFEDQRILIAEDIEINREIMSAILEDTGLFADFAENGQLAVSMFKAQPDTYSLILMDIHMPEMDGYEATRLIRDMELNRAKEIPIVAMTANVFREDVDNCLAAGMNDHIGKPIDEEDLFSKLDQYLP